VASARCETGVGALEEIHARFGSWHEPISVLINATKLNAVNYLPIEELVRPLSSYVHGRTVLIGDAAHAMTPNLGQGANQALEAATLCGLLTPRPNSGERELSAALLHYDGFAVPARSVSHANHTALGSRHRGAARSQCGFATRCCPLRQNGSSTAGRHACCNGSPG
jgi:2-polyprenyl-6-methoxyphenol hydroxylase-like FAD-dependent oxidoreductase